MTISPRFTAADRKTLTAAIGKEIDRLVSAGRLYLYPEPHPKSGRSVYLLQLEPAVLECLSCEAFFKGAKDARAAFYVGKTGKAIADRLAQHREYSSHDLKRGRASAVAPHLIKGNPRIEIAEGATGRSLERRIKFSADQRQLEEIVIPRLLRKLGFGTHAGGKTNPDGTWVREAVPHD
jgi:hypothetical protein